MQAFFDVHFLRLFVCANWPQFTSHYRYLALLIVDLIVFRLSLFVLCLRRLLLFKRVVNVGRSCTAPFVINCLSFFTTKTRPHSCVKVHTFFLGTFFESNLCTLFVRTWSDLSNVSECIVFYSNKFVPTMSEVSIFHQDLHYRLDNFVLVLLRASIRF